MDGIGAPCAEVRRRQGARPLKAGVLVDLMLTPDAGGHVKYWQRIAEAAARFPGLIDLTVHFNGREPGCAELATNVRYVLLPPVFSTARLMRNIPDHTDLGLRHRGLLRHLPDYEVLHTTDAFFCYSRTATRFARRNGVPIVSSVHTNTPEYARITAHKLLGSPLIHRLACDVLHLPDFFKLAMQRRLRRHLRDAASALDSHSGLLPRRAHWALSLRRGLDRNLFAPHRRDRAWLEQRFGLPPDHLILMYAGKLDAGKNVGLLAPVVEALRAADVRAHLLCAGEGGERAALEAALGPVLACAGVLDQAELARAYASADLFLFPSAIDECGNAALEALASGLPALLAAGSGVAGIMAECPGARVLPGNQSEPWVAAILDLAQNPERRAEMGRAARVHIERHIPSWAEVLLEDLLPVWQAAAWGKQKCGATAAS